MNFYDQMKNKLEQSPSRNFDQRMHALMDQEMALPQRQAQGLFRGFRLLIPATAMLALVAFYFHSKGIPSGLPIDSSPESVEFLQTYETLGSIEEDLINASDEEWNEVLAEVNS